MSKNARSAYVASKQRIEAVSANKTLEIAETGETYMIDASTAASNFTLTLPAVQEGAYFNFVLVAASAADSEVMIDTGSGAEIRGLTVVVTAAALVTAVADAQVKFPDSAALGSRLSLVCDGTNWIISEAVCSAAFATGVF